MHWLVQGADSANHVQNQTTCYPYMVTRQRKTGHVNVVNVLKSGRKTRGVEFATSVKGVISATVA